MQSGQTTTYPIVRKYVCPGANEPVPAERSVRDPPVHDGHSRAPPTRLVDEVGPQLGESGDSFDLVPTSEQLMDAGYLTEAPLGMAFLGKKSGAKVVVKTPKGDKEYEIMNIS